MYEAARDMMRADVAYGHDVVFVDVGVTIGATREPPLPSGVDDRGGFSVGISQYQAALDADVLVCHTGVLDNWLVQSQAPIIWILHGRPLASFRPEQQGIRKSYSALVALAKWPRVRRLVGFWPEYEHFWKAVMPPEKVVMLDAPSIDFHRFAPDGPKHTFKPREFGESNILIADSWRADIDLFEAANGAILAARNMPGLKVHFCAVEQPSGPWEILFSALRDRSALGHVSGRIADLDAMFRAVDVVLTPHRIATRIVGEALSCGTTLVADEGCQWTPYTAIMGDPTDVAAAVEEAVSSVRADPISSKAASVKMARAFEPSRYAKDMTEIYEAIIRESKG